MKTSLQISGTAVESVFDLVGHDEDSISRAIAWGLRRSPEFLQGFLRLAIAWRRTVGDVQLVIHQHEGRHGITDLEVVQEGEFHLVVEAKRGWALPQRSQLAKYASRMSFRDSTASLKALVTLSECSVEYAEARGVSDIDGIPVRHVSWMDLAIEATNARRSSGLHNKHLLDDLARYLRNQMSIQDQYSNQVFVVSLGGGTPRGWTVSWIDVVRKHHRYFHPVGDGWPSSPPNYVAFRYGGQLQSIHHVEKHSVIDDLAKACSGIPSKRLAKAHYLYWLGPAIIPGKVVKTGKIYPNGRVWCALDLLLTSSTVSDARDATKAREE